MLVTRNVILDFLYETIPTNTSPSYLYWPSNLHPFGGDVVLSLLSKYKQPSVIEVYAHATNPSLHRQLLHPSLILVLKFFTSLVDTLKISFDIQSRSVLLKLFE